MKEVVLFNFICISTDIKVLPLHVGIIDSNHPMLAGERYEIVCQAIGSKPAAITRWWLEGNKITSGFSEIIEEEFGNLTTNILQFVPVPEDNGKVLTCKAANPAIPKTTIETTLLLNVHFIPELNLTVNGSTGNRTITEGDYIHLECSIKANPWVYDVAWHFRNRLLTASKTKGIFINNQTLVIEQTKREHSGKYRCSAENFINRGTSNSVHLTIKYAPKCKLHDLQRFILTGVETVNMSCQVDADPKDVIFLWSLENPQGVITLQNWSDSNTLNYSPVTDHGFGVIHCWGRNSIGFQEIPCQFELLAANSHAPFCSLLDSD
ncbi:nephrin [Caerostris darwini]|uniref:Nephrin n=1 Tax=Caerostris darwini TaxID=1538125 RepID=A0AAV4U7N2_9ARAC|nr:nephrin [Caerostris darwini]